MSNGAANTVSSTKRAHPYFHFLAGLTSGVSSAVLLQPADLLKTRVQQSRSHSLVPVLKSILAGPHPVASLWRGTVPSALRTGFGSALYFTTLSSLRQIFANASTKSIGDVLPAAVKKSSSVLPKLTNTQNLMAGASARVFAGFVLMPFTVIKVRYESDLYAYKSIASASRSIYASEGLRGFFSGFGATAVRDAPYAGLYVVFYEACKTRLNKILSSETDQNPSFASSATINASSGVIAAGLATSFTNPFDAVKTRLQLMPKKYRNMVNATRIMLKEDGLKSFFDGLALRMGRKALSSALAWTVYEELISRAERVVMTQDQEKAVL
ncbi:MC family mitochondrial carrier protein [Exophiala viscosa]|uniref:Mitochondrial glycine transporter n=1 Tax=Exophiala viscosa TaxID=2486360 RepID=A0AAN6DZB6_9EURO|nr:MC family mitochondrial carrier protein [Exophiala viscosa]KAI1624213.1 MC family mitochondrial carrier protein [Exophiala viscosa]